MAPKIKVLVVDDSALARSLISRKLASDPGIDVVGTAGDGAEAFERVKALRPDVITPDVQMPVMDGLAALQKTMASVPTPVVMLSSLTGEDTDTTIRALELGAIDFFLKPSSVSPGGLDGAGKGLAETIKMAAAVPKPRLSARSAVAAYPHMRTVRVPSTWLPKRVVVIASSTGGPSALLEVVPHLPNDPDTGYLLVQHMPAGFTKSLAERLGKVSAIEVREAQEGDKVQAGLALMAPGGFHMSVEKPGRVTLLQTPPVHGVRPAADITMQTAAQVFGRSSIAAVLTGMGMDGTAGAAAIRLAGGTVIAQDEATCTVYGMPRSVVDTGHANAVVPLNKVASHIARLIDLSRPEQAGAA